MHWDSLLALQLALANVINPWFW